MGQGPATPPGGGLVGGGEEDGGGSDAAGGELSDPLQALRTQRRAQRTAPIHMLTPWVINLDFKGLSYVLPSFL